MAVVTRRPLRIVPAPGSRLDADEPVDLADDPAIAIEDFGQGRWSLHDAAGRGHWALVGEIQRSAEGAPHVEVVVNGWRFVLEVEDAERAELLKRAQRTTEESGHGGPLEIRAIIPGRIVAVAVAVGDSVSVGQQILVVEAMKMQNELRAPRAGTIERLSASVGATIDLGDLLVVIG